MSQIERQVKNAQRRLWLNRWLRLTGWTLMIGGAAWTAAWIVDRVFAFHWPMAWVALAAAGACLVASLIWLLATRDPASAAAAALDEAAGLKERVATGLHMQKSDDPFARAVQADAERVVTGLSAKKVIPVRWSRSLSFCLIMLGVAVLSLLFPELDILKKDEAHAAIAQRQAAANRVKLTVAKPVEAIKEVLDKNPSLEMPPEMKNLEETLKNADQKDPEALRREAIKQLDKLKDALKKQADADRFQALEETKKKLAKLNDDVDPKAEVGKLLDALSKGDFQEAQEEIKKMKEKLAERSHDGKVDPKQMEQMKKQLDDLAKKLQQAADEQQSKQELKNAGMSEEQAKRLLESLSKKDRKQLEKLAKDLAQRLKDKGMTEQKMKDMLEKMQKKMEAAKQCEKLGQKMDGASKKMEQGDPESAEKELQQAADQLSDMEQMEQAMNELESQMSQLDDARDSLGDQNKDDGDEDSKCKECHGSGFRKDGSPCPKCNGTGQCQNGGGRGSGPRDRNDNVDVDFMNKKAKLKNTNKGRIIGQQFVKGKALKGQSEAEFYDATEAAELDATDALNRNRVPRAYRKGVMQYFDRLGKDHKNLGAGDKPKSEAGAEKSSEKPAEAPAAPPGDAP